MKKRWGALAAVMLSVTAGANAGNTVHVPVDKPSIQAAIDAAATGDTVLVAPGTYLENINFHGKAITVISEQGPSVTIIDGQALDSVATFITQEGLSSVLSGFTLQNGLSTFSNLGHSDGGGIWISNHYSLPTSPTIQNNVIKNNRACEGPGIFIAGGSPVIQGNTITNNTQWSGCSGGIGGGGIAVLGGPAAQILNNVITGNTMTSSNGGGISLWGAGSPTVSGNIINRNTASGLSPCAEGGGISMVNESNALIVNNLITGNNAGCGGGIYWGVPYQTRGPFVVNNTIVGNNAWQGSGIDAEGFDASAQLINNIIVAPQGQYAVYCGAYYDNAPPIFKYNDIFGAPGFVFGGICGNPTGLNGNISADPLFVDSANGNFHVKAGSPVIDVGTSDQAPATDLDGNPRPVDGNGDGVVAFDLGAYELPASVLAPDLTATKINNVGGSVAFPNPWTWSISVANRGAASATFTLGQVVLRDNLPNSGLTYGAPSISGVSNIVGTVICSISSNTLACAASGNVTIGTPGSFVVQFTATPSIPGTFANPSGGGVCAADPDGVITESDERNNNCSDAVSVVAADLQLTNGISGGSPEAGSNINYLIAVTNNGISGASNVAVTDSLPANVSFVSCTPSAGTCTGGASVTANLGSLAVGAWATVTIVAKINCNVVNGAVISNTASVTSSTADPNLANNTNITTFTASNQVPVVNASVAVSSLTQNNHELINVGLAATASDGACPAPTSFTVRVFGNEDDQTPTAQNEVYSPDAKDIAVGTLRLRAERVSSGDGRVYLIVVKTTDAAGGAGFAATAVVVPKSTSAANVTAVNNQAAVAVAFANANNGNPPAGYFVIGDGPIVGQKQ